MSKFLKWIQLIFNYTKVESFVKKVLEKYSRIDILINNAGGQFPSPSEILTSKG